jgi:hypothetical protein
VQALAVLLHGVVGPPAFGLLLQKEFPLRIAIPSAIAAIAKLVNCVIASSAASSSGDVAA